MKKLSGVWLFTFIAAAAAIAQPRELPIRAGQAEMMPGFTGEVVVRTASGPATVHVEVRNWTIRGYTRVEKLPLPPEGTVVVQVRGGELTTIINGERREWREDDLFTVPRGATLGVETEDDSAILQTIWISSPRG